MTQRRLDLHASALNDAEYELYTTSLADITLADEGNDNHDGTDKDKKGTEHDDAYYDRLTVSVREARAWLRGRYSHVTAVTIDNVCFHIFFHWHQRLTFGTTCVPALIRF